MRALRVWVTIGCLVGLVLTVIILRSRCERLQIQVNGLLDQDLNLKQMLASINHEADRLGNASKVIQADREELTRLRGEVVRLHQESSREKEKQKVATPPPPVPVTVDDTKTPEWPVAKARMLYSKILGMSIRTYANGHKGQMPETLLDAVSTLKDVTWAEMIADQLSPDMAEHVRADQFELVYKGNLRKTGREAGSVMIARLIEPVQLSNGRYARAVVFDDASGTILVADSLEALAAKEKEFVVP